MSSPSSVQTVELSDEDMSTTNLSPSRLQVEFKRLVGLWTSLQVSYYGGKYSIERVLALDEYTRTTSLSRVLLVCLGTPMPMVILVILQELLPLQDQAEGWDQNYGFWVRLTMLSAVTASTFLVQATFMVDGFTLSWRQLAVFMTGLSLIHTAASMTVSATLAFPIPFFYISMTPSFYIPLFTLLYVLLGKNSLKSISFIATQKSMGMVYPAYQLLFHKTAETQYFLPVVLLQPVIKLVAKNVVLRITKDLEDMTPEAVIFTVDFYNALYLATFMESASTLRTMIILIGTDVIQMTVVLLKMHRRSNIILQRLRQLTQTFADEENLLSALCLLCRNPHKLETQMNHSIRVRSCLQHRLNPQDVNLLLLLETSATERRRGLYGSHRWSSRNGSSYNHSLFCRRRVQPMPATMRTSSRPPAIKVTTMQEEPRPLSIEQHPNILRESLAVLYTMECLILTAYLEAMIPIFYGNYMMIMVHFPNAKYHTELQSVTCQNVEYTAQVVFLFGLLQVASFGLLAALIRRNCSMNILYHLAFVLETQMTLVQGKLMI